VGDEQTLFTTRRTLAADVKTLEADSNFPESENKTIPERVENDDGHTW
jgi:hypothetical protein